MAPTGAICGFQVRSGSAAARRRLPRSARWRDVLPLAQIVDALAKLLGVAQRGGRPAAGLARLGVNGAVRSPGALRGDRHDGVEFLAQRRDFIHRSGIGAGRAWYSTPSCLSPRSAPDARTAPFTPKHARPAAGRPPRCATPSSFASASTTCASGKRFEKRPLSLSGGAPNVRLKM